MNQRADELCVFAARCLNLPEDEHIDYRKKGGESLVSQPEARRSDRANVGSENGEITYSFGQK